MVGPPHAPAAGMDAGSLAFRLHILPAGGVLEAGTNLFWKWAGRVVRRRTGGFPVDDSGGGDGALHHGPVREPAEFFDRRGLVDCARGAPAEIPAGSDLDCSSRADPSAHGS